MAALAETRDVGSHLPLPPSVRRLCCIGDSLTYGQGVAPRQTLATHVARFANMVYPDQLVWVDNLGQSSGNIWHSWIPFARLLDAVRYDAAIFSICHNDAQIFESNSVRYGGDVASTWLTDGKLNPIVRATIGEMATVARQRNVNLILDFYTRWNSDAPVVDAIARECEGAGLPFVDLLRFLEEESGVSVAEFVASPFDGHPSDNGHRAAARRLVEELRDRWTPPPSEGGTLSERLIEACDQAVRDGWAPDDITHWALLVLEAKESVARRRRSRSDASPLGDLAGARVTIQERYLGWYATCAATAQERLLYERREELEQILERAYASIRNLDEMTFVLEHFRAVSAAAELWALIDGAGYFSQNNRLQELPGDLKARFLAKAVMPAPKVSADLSPLLRKFGRLRHDLSHELIRLASLLPEKFEGERLDPSARGLWQVTNYLINAATAYFLQFERITAEAVADMPSQPALFTNVDVWVERDTRRPKRGGLFKKRGGLFNLTVEADYIEPRRARRRSKLWAGADEDAYVYRFEMPLLLLGDIGIGVPDWDDLHKRFLDGELQIARVEISNFSSGSEQSKRRFVWTPAPGAEPIHWLKLEKLLIPA